MQSKISELKKLTSDLHLRDAELHLFKNFVENLPIGVLVFDMNGELFFSNKIAEDVLSQERFELDKVREKALECINEDKVMNHSISANSGGDINISMSRMTDIHTPVIYALCTFCTQFFCTI